MKRLVIAFLLTSTSLAADVTSSSGKTIECYCTDRNGARVELGETVCLHVGGRMFTAQCQMSLNNPMWREISPGCLSSSLQSSEEPLQSHPVDAEI